MNRFTQHRLTNAPFTNQKYSQQNNEFGVYEKKKKKEIMFNSKTEKVIDIDRIVSGDDESIDNFSSFFFGDERASK